MTSSALGDGMVPGGPGAIPDPATPASVLSLARVTKSFGPTQALRGVDIDFRAGEIHALVGENGAGKSTLLGVIAGFVTPDPPSLLAMRGQPVDLARHSPRSAQALGIAIVPQELAAIEPMSVAENIFLGRELRRGPFIRRAEMHRQAAALLDRLGTSIDPALPIERLSVAQRQLVEIAKALSHESRFLALDEPSAVLAGDELAALFAVIHRLADQGVAIAYVSHRLDEIFAHADRYTVLKDGQTVASGAVRDIDRAGLVRAMVGREVAESFPPRAGTRGAVRLQVRDLSVAPTVASVTFDLHAGEIVGVAGLMGSGRTTLAKAIFGAIPATSGTLTAGTATGPFRSPREALAAGLAYLPENRRREGLATQKSVRTNLTLLALGTLLRRPTPLIEARAETTLVRRLIEELEIRTTADGDDPVGRLSGGNQQKVVLGKWLKAEPAVLILDEPTRGIDVGTKEEIYRILRRLAAEGLAILVISSELIEVIGLSDRILVMAGGRLAGELPGAEATEEAVMALATTRTATEPAA